MGPPSSEPTELTKKINQMQRSYMHDAIMEELDKLAKNGHGYDSFADGFANDSDVDKNLDDEDKKQLLLQSAPTSDDEGPASPQNASEDESDNEEKLLNTYWFGAPNESPVRGRRDPPSRTK